MQTKWQRIHYMPATPIGPKGERVTGCKAHIALSRRAAREGMVLLKNDGNLLPFAQGTRLAVFGKAQADYVKGGGGSGDTTVAYVRSVLDGLLEKENEGRLQLYHPTSDYYADYVSRCYADGRAPGCFAEPALPAELLKQAASFTDTALICICRFSGEGYDRTGEPFDGDFYLSHEEHAMVDQVMGAFPRVAVVLNTGGVMDTGWFRNEPRIQAALLVWQGGMEGGLAAADLLVGDDCPSGHLSDTFADGFDAYPSSASFSESEAYVAYEEDIFVGYRYFETMAEAGQRVCYPFGYGLSYTRFVMDQAQLVRQGDHFAASIRVTNTGDRAGRHVVQLYVEVPQGKLGKAKRSLVGFAKTSLLAPGETETVAISFDAYDFASFDDLGKVAEAAYVLEAGTYRFFYGEHVRSLQTFDETWTLTDHRVLRQLSHRCVPHELKRRLLADGSYEALPTGGSPERKPWDESIIPFDGQIPAENPKPITESAWLERKGPMLIDVVNGKRSLEAFIDLLSDEDCIRLLGGQPNRGVANTFGFGNLQEMGIPNAMTADGPAGLRIQPQCGVNTTAFPCATLLACTWDAELTYAIGRAAALEVKENGIAVWLAPAINIHRNPRCGRNFEYYSEDPLLAGKLSAALIRGIQSEGVAASLKHFACNNKETNRRESDSRVSERALREIYLKAFEINMRESMPWTVMSSYNLINGYRASENADLLTGILRGEWGFDGVVTTDWYTHGEQWTEINAGNDIKMGCGMVEHSLQMLQEGKLNRKAVRESVKRVLQLMLRLD